MHPALLAALGAAVVIVFAAAVFRLSRGSRLVRHVRFALVALALSSVGLYGLLAHSVSQRAREIGVKRALGATRRRIGRDVIAESALMGALGGAGGLALGALVAVVLNAAVVSTTGTSMLLITGRLVIGTLAFAIALGVIGGLWPARRAARLDPAAALVQR